MRTCWIWAHHHSHSQVSWTPACVFNFIVSLKILHWNCLLPLNFPCMCPNNLPNSMVLFNTVNWQPTKNSSHQGMFPLGCWLRQSLGMEKFGIQSLAEMKTFHLNQILYTPKYDDSLICCNFHQNVYYKERQASGIIVPMCLPPARTVL